MTLVVHPVVVWAWIVVGVLCVAVAVVGGAAVLMFDEGPGWLAALAMLLTYLTGFAIFVALVLTVTSFIF